MAPERISVVLWKHNDNSGFGLIAAMRSEDEAQQLVNLLRDQYSGRDYDCLHVYVDDLGPFNIPDWGHK